MMNTAHFDPFDGDGSPEEGPNCPKCGGEMVWIDCVQCTGVDWMTGVSCLACDNAGGWYHCRPCREAYTLAMLEYAHKHELHQREMDGLCRELAELEERITESYIQAINNDILWHEQNPDPAFHAEYRKGFVNGLIQAKYLMQKVREVSDLW